MKNQIVILASILLLVSCTSDKEPVVVRRESSKTVSDCSNVEADRLLTLEVKGMTCVMGCGASIRKELFTTKAVSSVEFDFEEGREFNTATIAFDKDKVTVDKLVKLISTVNDKQFTIGKTSSEEYSSTCNHTSSTSSPACSSDSKKEESKIKTSESKIEIPNFLNLLSRFFTN